MDMETVESCWKQSSRNEVRRLQTDENGLSGMANYIVEEKNRVPSEKRWNSSQGLRDPRIKVVHSKRPAAGGSYKKIGSFVDGMVKDRDSIPEILKKWYPDMDFTNANVYYNDFNCIVFAGCWSHARRRFAEALKALPKAAQKNAKETVAYEAVSRIAAIYHLDNQMEGQPAKVRKMYRQANIRPLVEAFFAWAKEIQIKNQLSRGKTLDGINYCINQEVSLKAFLEDGDIPMDNNATESALRSFCLHKHTWKLIDSLDGANASAIIYSITETAKANNLNPFRYLEHVLTVLKDHQDDREYSFINDILPWSEKLPAICRSKTKATNI